MTPSVLLENLVEFSSNICPFLVTRCSVICQGYPSVSSPSYLEGLYGMPPLDTQPPWAICTSLDSPSKPPHMLRLSSASTF